MNGNKFLNLLSTNFFRKIECFNQKNKNISENYVMNLLNQEIFSINKNIDQEIESFSSIKNFSLLLKQKLNLLNNNNNNIYSNNFLCLVPLINKIFSPNFKKIFYNKENIKKEEKKEEEEEKTLKNEEFETPIVKRSLYKLKTNLIPFHERKNLEESFYFNSDENESSLDSQELKEKNYNEHLKSDLDYFYKPNNLFEDGFQILTKKSKKFHSILKKSFSHPNFLIKNLFLPFVKINFSLFLKEKNKNHKLFQIMCNKILFNKKFSTKNNKIIFPIFGKNKITSGMLMKDFIVGKTIKNNYIKNLKLKQEIEQENEIKNEEKKIKEDFKLFLEKEFEKSSKFLNELQKEINPFEDIRNNQRFKTAKLKSKVNFNFENEEKKLNLNLNNEFSSSEESINEQLKKEEKKKKIIFKLNSNDENNISIEKNLFDNKLNDNNNDNKIIDNNKLSNKISPNNSKGKIKSILKNTTKKNIQFLNNNKNDINDNNNENINNKNNENVNNSKKIIKENLNIESKEQKKNFFDNNFFKKIDKKSFAKKILFNFENNEYTKKNNIIKNEKKEKEEEENKEEEEKEEKEEEEEKEEKIKENYNNKILKYLKFPNKKKPNQISKRLSQQIKNTEKNHKKNIKSIPLKLKIPVGIENISKKSSRKNSENLIEKEDINKEKKILEIKKRLIKQNLKKVLIKKKTLKKKENEEELKKQKEIENEKFSKKFLAQFNEEFNNNENNQIKNQINEENIEIENKIKKIPIKIDLNFSNESKMDKLIKKLNKLKNLKEDESFENELKCNLKYLSDNKNENDFDLIEHQKRLNNFKKNLINNVNILESQRLLDNEHCLTMNYINSIGNNLGDNLNII